MDKIKNPFSPGADSPPPERASRDSILEQARVLLIDSHHWQKLLPNCRHQPRIRSCDENWSGSQAGNV